MSDKTFEPGEPVVVGTVKGEDRAALVDAATRIAVRYYGTTDVTVNLYDERVGETQLIRGDGGGNLFELVDFEAEFAAWPAERDEGTER